MHKSPWLIEERPAGLDIGIYAYDGFLWSQSLPYLYVTRDTSREEISMSNNSQQLLGGPMPLLEHYLHLAILQGRTSKNLEISQTKAGIHD